MKINRNKGNLQSQLAKMLQAGMENVDTEQKIENQSVSMEQLRANNQTHNNTTSETSANDAEQNVSNKINNTEPQQNSDQAPQQAAPNTLPTDASVTPQPAVKQVSRQSSRTTTRSSRKTSIRSRRSRQPEPEAPRLNAAQRHEVPDHNAKYAGEPIKSVGCRMPQSLYARMLQYKAMNDSQLNRITLNDIIIEAVEKFMDENQ